jgi:CelD/BcsL family acetyltransferase involved in cellulose biosynthesis
MDVSVVLPGQLGPSELAAWRRAQASHPVLDSAFLSPEFAVAVSRSRPGARVAVVRSAGQPVAFLPFERGRLGIGRAIALGVSDVQAVVCEPGMGLDLPELVSACGMGVWEFDHAAYGLEALAPWTYVTETSRVIDVADGYDAYLREGNRGSSRTYRSLMQKSRKLAREHGEVVFEFSSSDLSALATLVHWKSSQYDRTGRFDRFARPWVKGLVSELAGSTAPACRGTLSTLSAGGRLVAVHFGIGTGTNLSLWFPAYDPAFAQYSPGLLLFLKMAEAAASLGTVSLDLGKGTEGYKQWLASREYPVASGRVEARFLPSLVRHIEVGTQRRADSFVLGHPQLRSHLPGVLNHIDRIRR